MEGQKHLFEIVKSKISNQLRLADEIEGLLGVSSDSAYRRIRGEKELSFSELQKICRKYNLSMDEILNYKSNHGALFHFGPVVLSDQESYVNNLKRLLDILTTLKSASEKEIFFSALDIPFYHYAKFPDLSIFKQYVWNDTMSRNMISYNEFYKKLDKDRIVSISEQFHNTLMFIPTKEIWTNQTIDTMLRLLEHYYEIGAFENKNMVMSLLDQLTGLLDMVKQYADDGYMGGERKTPFFQYLSFIDLESAFILARRDNQLICSIKLNTVNSISTDNEFVCNGLKKWVDDLISKSVQISGISIKERVRFYDSSRNKIDVLRNKIKMR